MLLDFFFLQEIEKFDRFLFLLLIFVSMAINKALRKLAYQKSVPPSQKYISHIKTKALVFFLSLLLLIIKTYHVVDVSKKTFVINEMF